MRTMETKRRDTKRSCRVQYCTLLYISCCNTNDPRVSTHLLYRHFCVRANKIAVAVVRRSVDVSLRGTSTNAQARARGEEWRPNRRGGAQSRRDAVSFTRARPRRWERVTPLDHWVVQFHNTISIIRADN